MGGDAVAGDPNLFSTRHAAGERAMMMAASRNCSMVLVAGVLMLTIVCGVGAQQPQLRPDWIADPKTGCRVWNSNPQPGETVNWDGSCLNGRAEGRGTLQWFKDGNPSGRYEGEYRDGRLSGWGVSTFADGARYEGEYREGKLSGPGVFTFADGGRYEGEWRDDKRNGRGIFTSTSGDRYEGEYRDGEPNGRGVFTSASGDRYEGEFRDGKANGWGVATLTSGARYEGTWTNGCFRQGERRAFSGTTPEECGFK